MDRLASDHMKRSRIVQRISYSVEHSADEALAGGKIRRLAQTDHRIAMAYALDSFQRHGQHTLAAKADDLARIASAGRIYDLAAISDAAQRAGTFHALPSRIEHTPAPPPCISPAQIAIERIH
jgi:hypothetical protein